MNDKLDQVIANRYKELITEVIRYAVKDIEEGTVIEKRTATMFFLSPGFEKFVEMCGWDADYIKDVLKKRGIL